MTLLGTNIISYALQEFFNRDHIFLYFTDEETEKTEAQGHTAKG